MLSFSVCVNSSVQVCVGAVRRRVHLKSMNSAAFITRGNCTSSDVPVLPAYVTRALPTAPFLVVIRMTPLEPRAP